MIAFLSGTIRSKQEKTVVLDVNGVGYLVHVTRGLLEKMEKGSSIELYIHTNVREDDISLFGFATQEEWMFFRMLITVSGVGPKSALEILNMPMAKVRQAIAKKDSAFLTQIPGIGVKTAERIIVDLHGKIKEEFVEGLADTQSPIREDIVQALVTLGYSRQQVTQGLSKIPTEISREEEIIKYFLQNI